MKLPFFAALVGAFACGFVFANAANQDKQAKIYKMTGSVVNSSENIIFFKDPMGQIWQFEKAQGFKDASVTGQNNEISYVMTALSIQPKEGSINQSPQVPPKGSKGK